MHNWTNRNLNDDEILFIKSLSMGWTEHFVDTRWENKIIICSKCSSKLYATKIKINLRDTVYIYHHFGHFQLLENYSRGNNSIDELIIETKLSCNELIIKNIID